MSTGIAATLSCDPTLKVEIWLFQQVGVSPPGPAGGGGTPVYRRLPYNLVRFDGDPTEYIEPCYPSDFNKVLDGSGDPIGYSAGDGSGQVVEMRYFAARPFEVFSFNDV